eukprot:GHVT01053216.1.p1 GENE.GHVT01053216.1~~GHVT01053216.1.p1  ORF type:complete len:352 (+),score=82.97 GHVT01053216.1:285-1340(+)
MFQFSLAGFAERQAAMKAELERLEGENLQLSAQIASYSDLISKAKTTVSSMEEQQRQFVEAATAAKETIAAAARRRAQEKTQEDARKREKRRLETEEQAKERERHRQEALQRLADEEVEVRSSVAALSASLASAKEATSSQEQDHAQLQQEVQTMMMEIQKLIQNPQMEQYSYEHDMLKANQEQTSKLETNKNTDSPTGSIQPSQKQDKYEKAPESNPAHPEEAGVETPNDTVVDVVPDAAPVSSVDSSTSSSASSSDFGQVASETTDNASPHGAAPSSDSASASLLQDVGNFPCLYAAPPSPMAAALEQLQQENAKLSSTLEELENKLQEHLAHSVNAVFTKGMRLKMPL